MFSLCKKYYSLKEIVPLEQVGKAGPLPPPQKKQFGLFLFVC